MKRLERRLEETRDDLETTIKAEIMGTGLNWRAYRPLNLFEMNAQSADDVDLSLKLLARWGDQQDQAGPHQGHRGDAGGRVQRGHFKARGGDRTLLGRGREAAPGDDMSDEPENITAALLREIRDELRGLRREVVDVRTLTLGTFDRMKRLERRLEETRDDLETTIKAEIMGTGLNWRRDLEDRLDALEETRKPPHG